MLLMSLSVALLMRITGALLMTSLLIIPAATARQLARSPKQMMVYAVLISILAIICGIFISSIFDTPTTPTIVCASVTIFMILLPFQIHKKI